MRTLFIKFLSKFHSIQSVFRKKSMGLLVFFLRWVSLQAETVEIVSNMYTEEILTEACFERVKASYKLRITDQKHQVPITAKHKTIKRYLIFNIRSRLASLDACPSQKKVLFMMEPECVPVEEAKRYSRVYTWDDEAIDNEKFFKFYFPDVMPMLPNLPAFEERKLCTMVVRNWHATHRGPVLEWFSTKPKGEFEFYGSPYPNLSYNKCYKGRIPGLNCGEEKLEVLKHYRFCICFENRTDLRGYVSEKIFPCFAAGCIPIYWGAPNIETYIPKECFIDYRAFQSDEELYRFIKSMTKEEYEQYLECIRAFLSSDKAQLFSPQHFAETLYEAVTQ